MLCLRMDEFTSQAFFFSFLKKKMHLNVFRPPSEFVHIWPFLCKLQSFIMIPSHKSREHTDANVTSIDIRRNNVIRCPSAQTENQHVYPYRSMLQSVVAWSPTVYTPKPLNAQTKTCVIPLKTWEITWIGSAVQKLTNIIKQSPFFSCIGLCGLIIK